jgi:dTDP-4-amino-4,6-dideoxygalactose transaminase
MVSTVRYDKPFLPFHRPTILPHHVKAVATAARSGWLTSAGKVDEFETAFGKRVDAKHAIAVNSCTAALHLALIALGVGPGDEVITSPITFASAVNVIEHVGAKPVFVDVDPSNLTIDPDRVRDAITTKTRMIVATHFAGFPADMYELDRISKATGIPVITDAAHAIETKYHGRPSGKLGKASCYSFYATKNITTGEGGMLTTDDDKLAARVRILRLHGMTKDAWKRYGPEGYKHWDIVEPGWKYNMSDINAALGLAQLEDMDSWLRKRAALVNAYSSSLKKVKMLPTFAPNITSALHLLIVRVPERDRVMDEMQISGIGVGVHFRAVHRLKYYSEKYKIPKSVLPVSEKASREVLSLPLYPTMKFTDVSRVVHALESILK